MKGRALLAWNIRRLRAERGISQERLAVETETDRAYMSEIENERGNPTVDLLDRLAVSLKVPLLEFFRSPEPGEKPPKSLPSGRPIKRKRGPTE
jgi:transcriptional regulator with XRE-family HTH domain